MYEKIVQLNEAVIKSELKELVRGSVEETLNELLEAEAEKLTADRREAHAQRLRQPLLRQARRAAQGADVFREG